MQIKTHHMKFSNKTWVALTLVIIAVILAGIQWLSTGANGESDSIFHYQIARYAFKYPYLFLAHWGKPLFTILSSPFAQFGYTGAIAFNLLCGLLSGWFAYGISRKLGYRHAWAAIVFTVFTPLYLIIMYSALTEILFSLVIIAAIYLFMTRRFILAAIVISLVPFVRTEGTMYIFLFIPALIWMKQYRAIPFLLTGFFAFSLIGMPYYHDFFWFFNKMPYSVSSSSLYGKGSFWIYFGQMEYILNYPLIILAATGLVFILVNLKKGLTNLRDIKNTTLYFLIIPGFFGFILLHSYLWWKGLGVLASLRFIACVLPLGAIIAVTGFEWIMERIKGSTIISLVIGAYVIGLVVYKPFTYKILPLSTGATFGVMEQLTNWLKSSPYVNNRAFYTDPLFPFYMEIDPFDEEKCSKKYSYDNTNPATLLKPGELLIWDAQFAGYEGHLPFDSLINNKSLRLLNVFTPANGFTIIGGEKYKLAVFLKAPRDTSTTSYNQIYFNDFESGLPEDQMAHATTEFSFSGKQSIILTPDYVYSPAMEGKLINLPGKNTISVKASVRILNPFPSEKGLTVLVISTDDSLNKTVRYTPVNDKKAVYKPDEWIELSVTDIIDRNVPAGGNLKVYVWYKGKSRIYVDDLKVEYMPLN